MGGPSTEKGLEMRKDLTAMRRTAIRILAVVGIVLLGVAPVFAGPDEIAIEEQLATRLQRSLDSIYGPNNFIVRVGVTLTTPRYEVRYTQQSKAAVSAEPKKSIQDEYYAGISGHSKSGT